MGNKKKSPQAADKIEIVNMILEIIASIAVTIAAIIEILRG